MKRLIIAGLLLGYYSLSAQTFGEWFQQSKTQRKYLLEQIVAYQHYLIYLKKGYSIVQSGNRIIRNGKLSDLQLHQNHIDSLSTISPIIRHHPVVRSLLDLQAAIEPLIRATRKEIGATPLLSTEEVSYLGRTLDGLTQATGQSVQETLDVLTAGKLQMTEAERLHRIQELYADIQVRHGFLLSLRSQSVLLQKFRYHEHSDLIKRKKIAQP